MTREEFAAAAIATLRSSVGWQTAIARRLGVDSRTVRRWIKRDHAPDWVLDHLSPTQWPADEWIIGQGKDNRKYIIHANPPRFVARYLLCTYDGKFVPTEAQGPVCGTILSVHGNTADEHIVICDVDWIDDIPIGDRPEILVSAGAAIREITK